jgi:hypothetical protein
VIEPALGILGGGSVIYATWRYGVHSHQWRDWRPTIRLRHRATIPEGNVVEERRYVRRCRHLACRGTDTKWVGERAVDSMPLDSRTDTSVDVVSFDGGGDDT